MPKDIDDDYFYGTGTINEELENFQVYEKDGELHVHDTRTDDVVKVTEDGSLQSLTSRINNPSSVGASPLKVGGQSDGVEAAFQVASNDEDDELTDRKVRFFFYDATGSSRLAEWSPAEVEMGVGPDNHKGAEYSAYLRDVPLSEDSQSQKKWLNVRTEAEDSHPDEFNFKIRLRDLHSHRIRGADNHDLRVQYEAGDDADGSGVNKVEEWYQDSNGGSPRFRRSFNPANDAMYFFGDDSSLVKFDLAQHLIDFRQNPTEDVVWEASSYRPSDPVQGQRFFDTDLGQPIWYDGTDWVDATGTSV